MIAIQLYQIITPQSIVEEGQSPKLKAECPVDVRVLGSTSPFFCIQHSIIHSLSFSLSLLLVHYYVIAGRVCLFLDQICRCTTLEYTKMRSAKGIDDIPIIW